MHGLHSEPVKPYDKSVSPNSKDMCSAFLRISGAVFHLRRRSSSCGDAGNQVLEDLQRIMPPMLHLALTSLGTFINATPASLLLG
jgi:hypothetical protein